MLIKKILNMKSKILFCFCFFLVFAFILSLNIQFASASYTCTPTCDLTGSADCPDSVCTIKSDIHVSSGTIWKLKELTIDNCEVIVDSSRSKYCNTGGTGGLGYKQGGLSTTNKGGSGGRGGCASSKGETGKTTAKSSDGYYCSGGTNTLKGQGGKGGGDLTIYAETLEFKSYDYKYGTINANGAPGKDGCSGDSAGNWEVDDWAAGGQGGGGGGGGGNILIIVSYLKGNGFLNAKGGGGGDGGNGGHDRDGEDGGGAGGGAGGNGGNITIIIKTEATGDIKYLARHLVEKGTKGDPGEKRYSSDNSEAGNDNAEDGQKGTVDIIPYYCEFKGEEYAHGEEWCDYDANPAEEGSNGVYNIINGNDAFGSNHRALKCEFGKVKPAGVTFKEARKQLCFSVIGKTHAVTNDWKTCFSPYFTNENLCLTLKHHTISQKCKWIAGTCVPNYPPGAFVNLGESEDSSGVCLYGDDVKEVDNPIKDTRTSCDLATGYYTKYVQCLLDESKDGWNASGGSGSSWIDKMLEKCTAVGDCGNTPHFDSDVKTESGYFLRPVISSSTETEMPVFFECARVITNNTDSLKCEDADNYENSDDGKRYRCESYEGDEFCSHDSGTCRQNPFSASPPMITNFSVVAPLECELKAGLSELGSSQPIKISCNDGSGDICIKPNTYLEINYTTEKDAVCRWYAYPKELGPASLGDIKWSEMFSAEAMPNVFGDEHFYIFPPDVFPQSPIPGPFNVTLHIWCMNRAGQLSFLDYQFEYCLTQDNEGPIINTNAGSVVSSITSMPVLVSVNEQVKNCTYNVSVNNNIKDNGIINKDDFKYNGLGFEKEIVINLDRGNQDHLLKIKCFDLYDNKGTYQKVIDRTVNSLTIKSATVENSVNGIVQSCTDLGSVTINVITEGGESNIGNAICDYDGTEFTTTGTNSHSTTLDFLSLITHRYLIRCKDAIEGVYGNSVSESISFELKKDNEKPNITAVYIKGANLVVHTNEKANCSYNQLYWLVSSGCSFDAAHTVWAGKFTNTNTDNFIHSHPLTSGPGVWYVKCIDWCDNGRGEDEDCYEIVPQNF